MNIKTFLLHFDCKSVHADCAKELTIFIYSETLNNEYIGGIFQMSS